MSAARVCAGKSHAIANQQPPLDHACLCLERRYQRAEYLTVLAFPDENLKARKNPVTQPVPYAAGYLSASSSHLLALGCRDLEGDKGVPLSTRAVIATAFAAFAGATGRISRPDHAQIEGGLKREIVSTSPPGWLRCQAELSVQRDAILSPVRRFWPDCRRGIHAVQFMRKGAP